MSAPIEFVGFGKIARLVGDMTITEKIDGTNAAIGITDDGQVWAQSRSRIITPKDDNFGFAVWVQENVDELSTLGPGVHFGEWWGRGIQRNYGLQERRFSLFNVERWSDIGGLRPPCCHVVPTLDVRTFDTHVIHQVASRLAYTGSNAAPGFDNPEGVMVWLHRARLMLKHPFDANHKTEAAA